MKLKLLAVLAASIGLLTGCDEPDPVPPGPEGEFTVTFVNYDETVLGTDTVKAGETAVYEGETPTRPADSEYTYTFSGWDKDLTNVQSSFTTTAQYTSTPIGGGEVLAGLNLMVNNSTTYPLTLNEGNTDPNCEEYMVEGVTLAKDDTFIIYDADEDETVLITSYRDQDPAKDAGSAYYVGDLTHDAAGTSTVVTAGTYSMYLKFWLDGAIELWVGAITLPDPAEDSLYIVGEGPSFTGATWNVSGGFEMEVNPNPGTEGSHEWMITMNFQVGDNWKVCNEDMSKWIDHNGESEVFTTGLMAIENTNAVVQTAGRYTVYGTLYADGGTSSWVAVAA